MTKRRVIKKIVDDITKALSNSPELKLQLELYKSLRKKEILLDEFFKKQKRLDNIMLKNAEEVDEGLLKELNPKTYEHESKHKSVWDKYGVKTKYYCWHSRQNTYFTMDIDFKEVANQHNLDSEQVVSIYAEMQSATFRGKSKLGYDVVMDVLQYEALNGLNDFNSVGLYNAFSKYDWNVTVF